jgi:hypothetical protein
VNLGECRRLDLLRLAPGPLDPGGDVRSQELVVDGRGEDPMQHGDLVTHRV